MKKTWLQKANECARAAMFLVPAFGKLAMSLYVLNKYAIFCMLVSWKKEGTTASERNTKPKPITFSKASAGSTGQLMILNTLFFKLQNGLECSNFWMYPSLKLSGLPQLQARAPNFGRAGKWCLAENAPLFPSPPQKKKYVCIYIFFFLYIFFNMFLFFLYAVRLVPGARFQRNAVDSRSTSSWSTSFPHFKNRYIRGFWCASKSGIFMFAACWRFSRVTPGRHRKSWRKAGWFPAHVFIYSLGGWGCLCSF